MSDRVKWNLEADFIQACNCDYGCPCEFSAPPTRGFCEGVGAWRVNRGQFGDVKLDGLGFGFAAHWPRALHEGNGTCSLMFDVRADERQRDALMQIASGKQGGMPFEIIVQTFSTVLEPLFLPFTFHFNGRESLAYAGNAMRIAVEPIKNPVTGAPESVRVQHATGFVFKEADCVSAKQMDVDAGTLKFSWPQKAAFIAQVKYSN